LTASRSHEIGSDLRGRTTKTKIAKVNPPIVNDTNDSPLRVEVPVSLQREQQPASFLKVVVPTTPNQTTPNSHRRLQTISRMFVTPTTPHHLVMRSAGPHNVSQDRL
jgi:hypothetical protein